MLNLKGKKVMAFRRTTNLPCKISRKITLRLHPDIYYILKEEADNKTLETGRLITIGDLIRDVLNKSDLTCKGVPQTSSMTNDIRPDQSQYHQLLMFFA